MGRLGVLLLILRLATTRTAPKSPALQLFEKAFSLFQSGALAQADAMFDDLLANDATELEAHKSLGSALLNSGNIKQALGDLSGARAAWSKAGAASDSQEGVKCMVLLSLGSADLEEGSVREGMARYNKARMSGCDASLQQTMAARIAAALEYAEGRIETDETPSFELVWRVGFLASVTGKADRALELFEMANRIRPEHQDTTLLRETASLHTLAKQHKLAEVHLKRCVEIDPKHADTWFELGKARSNLRDGSGAQKAFERAQQLDGTHRGAIISHGRLLEESGERVRAAELYKSGEERGALQSRWQRGGEHMPGLSAHAFHEVSKWPIVRQLEHAWEEIRDEVKEALESDALRREAMPDTEGLTARSTDWIELNLYFKGKRFEKNLKLLPKLDAFLSGFPEITSQVKGATKVSVISPGEVKGWLRVGSETKHWKEGKCVGFDDSFEHQVWYTHPDKPRVVLIVDVWHPDMDEESRVASLTEQGEVEVYNYHKARYSQHGRWFNSTAYP